MRKEPEISCVNTEGQLCVKRIMQHRGKPINNPCYLSLSCSSMSSLIEQTSQESVGKSSTNV